MTTSVSSRAPGTLNPTRQQLDELDALLQRMLELPVNKGEDVPPSAVEEEPPSEAQARQAQPDTPEVYVVVETASPRPLPPASGFEPRPPRLLAPVADAAGSSETPPSADAPDEPSTPTPPAETWVPLRSVWQPTAQTWPPLADSWHQANNAPTAPVSAAAAETPPSEVVDTTPLTTDVATAVEAATQVGPQADAVGSTQRLSLDDAAVAEPRLLLPLIWFNQGFDGCLAPLGTPGRWLCGRRGRQLLGVVGLASLAAAVVVVVSTGMGWTW